MSERITLKIAGRNEPPMIGSPEDVRARFGWTSSQYDAGCALGLDRLFYAVGRGSRLEDVRLAEWRGDVLRVATPAALEAQLPIGRSRLDVDEVKAILDWTEAKLTIAEQALNFPRRCGRRAFYAYQVASWLERLRTIATPAFLSIAPVGSVA